MDFTSMAFAEILVWSRRVRVFEPWEVLLGFGLSNEHLRTILASARQASTTLPITSLANVRQANANCKSAMHARASNANRSLVSWS